MQEADFDSTQPATTRATTAEFAYMHPLQAGKVVGLIYAFLALIFVPFLILIILGKGGPDAVGEIIGAAAMMLIYPLVGFLGGVVIASLYNFAAKQIGGFRIDLK
ncbi:hypothetical protein Pla108_04930 [Botrimarina colliarenosi]|uniref:DUF3566 domain-containing protein n=2 Tax=Botrimarina colliarenosi TaxID=2528001 RepID=A0A5C6AJH5_9BACT|nr:hypothetical protein Pla108_04930 [Botrimarina colliarenosi]